MEKLEKIIHIKNDFERHSRSLLLTLYNSGQESLNRFKNFIDEEEQIRIYLDENMKNVNFDWQEYFEKKNNSPWINIKIPPEEKKQMKAIYDFIEYLITTNTKIQTYSHHYYCKSRNINDKIRNFINDAIKPLIDYIYSNLESQIEYLTTVKKLEINNYNNTNSQILQQGGKCNNANNIKMNQNFSYELEHIKKDLLILKELIKKEHFENKERTIEAINTLEDELSRENPRRFSIKILLNGLKSILSISDESNAIIEQVKILGSHIDKLV